ncbi:MAG: FecR domain-containing protein [Tannerella sp.]|jgi:ferric-dicitrate binding protein FerR (iron transport regulator)|nr:FecR domain-containing protein [Tannerella sp.]
MNILYSDSEKKYKSCSAEELLQDDFFISSKVHPTEATEAFWHKLLMNGNVDIESYRFACHFIESVQVRSEEIREEEKKALWEKIELHNRHFREKRSRRHRLFYLLAGTSVAAFVAFALLLFRDGTLAGDTPDTLGSIENVKPPDTEAEHIQLVLTDEEAVSLEGKEAEIAYGDSGIRINRQATELKKERTENEIAYNQLIVPKGKRSRLILADSTQIWVNACTRVVYPVAFGKERREIYVDGEVCLDVTHRDDCPFVVKTKTFSAEVLGTSFNLTAYGNDREQNLVLVSGSVRIHMDNREDVLLAPSEMFTSINGVTQIRTVHAEDYISWTAGIYQYESETLRVILKRLSRYYGQEIVCDPQVAGLKCSGKLDLKDELGVVLEGIALTAPVHYRYNYETHLITNK